MNVRVREGDVGSKEDIVRRERSNNIGSTTASDLRAMAQDMLRMGTHWAQAAQDWLDRTREEMDERDRGRGARCAGSRHGAGRRRGARDFESDYSGGGYDQVDRGAGYQASYASSYPPSGFGAADIGVRNYERQARGYRGVGPSNYSRSDERIREDLNERLTEADDLDASGITVEVSNGVATLGGVVAQRWMKHRAEDLADSCTGVRDVRNQLRVESDAGAGASDGGMEAHGSVRMGGASAEVHGSMATSAGNSAGGASPGTGGKSPGTRTGTGTNTRQDTPSGNAH